MATQEQDFNKETNRQSTCLVIKDSHGVTIDLTEVQCAQVLQSLLTLCDLRGRQPHPDRASGRGAGLLGRLLAGGDAEMQDVEVNSLRQGQSVRIENCTDVRISVRHVEVEKVVEVGLAMLRLMEQPAGGKAPEGGGPGPWA